MDYECGFAAVNNGKHCINPATGKCYVCKGADDE